MSLGPSSGVFSSHLPSSSLRTFTPSSPFPTATLLAATTTSTFFKPSTSTSDPVGAFVTSCASRSGSPSPNVVHVVIHTTLTISDYSRFYRGTPITAFRPAYTALSDGSLISSVYQPNLRVSEGWLVMGGALGVYFLRNTYRSIQYTRTVNARNKSLFHMLVLSQIIGVVVVVIYIVANFVPAFDCTAVGVLKKGGVLLSSTLLVTGILGTKAYRCLSNAGFVVVVLAFLRASIIAVSGVVIAEYRGGRRFTGTCDTEFESHLLPVSIVLQFVETCFICLCFLWAVYRSYRSPAEHARLSLTLTEDGDRDAPDVPRKDSLSRDASRRGWWDYVPNPNEKRPLPVQTVCTGRPCDGTFRCNAHRFRRWLSGEPVLSSTVFEPRESIVADPPEAARISSLSNVLPIRLSTAREPEYPRAPSPPPPSVMDRIIRYVPRADLFRNMLKNELLYTTFISAALLVIAVVMLVGVTQELLLGANSWIMLDWLVISLCTMHSFGRVARRHEREAWLQDPKSWGPMHRAQVEDRTMLRPRNSRRAWSPVSVDYRQRYRPRGDSSLPSEAGNTVDLSSLSAYSSARQSRIRSISITTPRDPDPDLPVLASAASSAAPSPAPSPSLDGIPRPPFLRQAYAGTPTILPSPDWPSTNVSTPHSGSQTVASRASTAAAPPLLRSSSVPAPRSRRRSRGWESHSPCPGLDNR